MSTIATDVEAIRGLTETQEATGAYFDQQFARRFAALCGKSEEDVLGIVRRQADLFMSEGRYKGLRNRLGGCTRDACNAIVSAYSSQLSGDTVSRYDAADVIARWNLAWAYGAFCARAFASAEVGR